MRQIGTLQNESEAGRFAAYLVTKGIAAHAEQDGDGWAIWVRDENQVEQARQALEDYRHNPDSSAYRGVERVAEEVRRKEAQQRDQARRNIVEMRGLWRRGGSARKAPLTFVLIGLSVLASLWTSFGSTPAAVELSFLDLSRTPKEVWEESIEVRFSDILSGEVWRLITPIFVHLHAFHLAFNMYWLWVFGAQIEDRRKTVKLGLLVLALALLSNVAQSVIEGPNFFGMSGVGFGLFGYVWMKSLFEPASGLFVHRTTAVMFIVWFFLCLTGLVGPIANTAHGAGLFAGVAIGYVPTLWSSRPESDE